MAFTDLPFDWSQRPVTDPAVFTDVVDLIVTVRDRYRGCLSVWLCSPTGRLTQPILVEAPDELPSNASDTVRWGSDAFAATQMRRALESLATVLSTHARPGSGLVVVIGRSGRADTTDADRHTHEIAIEVCRTHGIPLLGAAVATPERVWALPPAADSPDWACSA